MTGIMMVAIFVCLFISVQAFAIYGAAKVDFFLQPGYTVRLGATSNKWFKTCTLKNNFGSEVCRITLHGNPPHRPVSPCYGNIKYTGDEQKFTCEFEIEYFKNEDFGSWLIEIKSWYLYYSVTKTFNVLNAVNEKGCYEENIDFYKNDISTTANVSTKKGCQQLCFGNEKCELWSYDIHNKYCYMKDVNAILKRQNKSGIVSGLKECPGCFRFGVSTGNENLHWKNSSTVYECREGCKSKRGCKFFEWHHENKRCYLISYLPDQVYDALNSLIGVSDCAESLLLWEKTPIPSIQPLLTPTLHLDSTSTQFPHSPKRTTSTTSTTSTQSTTPAKTTNTTTADLTQLTNSPALGNGDESSQTGIVIGVLLVVIILLIVVGIVVCKRRQIQRRISATNSFSLASRATSMTSAASERRRRNIETTRPIEKSSFAKGVRDGVYPGRDEYSLLNMADDRLNVFSHSNSVGKKFCPSNQGALNRYFNILPYDHNRVELKAPIKKCNYINASWIKNVDPPPVRAPVFIAAQGPLPHTISHFLQMIVENQVKHIIMLTKLKEKGEDGVEVEKCSQYWPTAPGSTATFDHIQIKTKSEMIINQLSNTTLRVFEIRDTIRNEVLDSVYQYQFSAWPDFGVPSSSKSIVDLTNYIRNKFRGSNDETNVVVHCSAGVGRTGTFIALYRLIEKIDSDSDTIDVFKEVFKLREDRCKMVQKEEQYKFLYACVAYHLNPPRQLEREYVYTLYD